MEWKRVETLSGVETLSEMETRGTVKWNGNVVESLSGMETRGDAWRMDHLVCQVVSP